MDMLEHEAKSDQKQNNLIGIEHTWKCLCTERTRVEERRVARPEFREAFIVLMMGRLSKLDLKSNCFLFINLN